jgi:hypothetical protein
LPVIIGSIFVSGIVWLGVSLLNSILMSSTAVTPGIALVYLPAGFRLLIILLFGFWGALGIFLTNPILFVEYFGTASITEMVINSGIAAFVPYLVVSVPGHRLIHLRRERPGCHAFQLKPRERCVLINAQSRQNRHSRQAMSRNCGHGRLSTLFAEGRSCIRPKNCANLGPSKPVIRWMSAKGETTP